MKCWDDHFALKSVVLAIGRKQTISNAGHNFAYKWWTQIVLGICNSNMFYKIRVCQKDSGVPCPQKKIRKADIININTLVNILRGWSFNYYLWEGAAILLGGSFSKSWLVLGGQFQIRERYMGGHLNKQKYISTKCKLKLSVTAAINSAHLG